jgi:hypothetical protein
VTEFCSAHLSCAFEECVNFRNGHRKGHQNDADDVLVGKALYKPSFSEGELQNTFKVKLREIFIKVCHDEASQTHRNVLEVHQNARTEFFTKKENPPESFKSRLTCFLCLTEIPEHTLPCGHVLCTRCVHEAEKPAGSCFYYLKGCPLGLYTEFDELWLASIKPDKAGVCIMSLDRYDRLLGGALRPKVTTRPEVECAVL